MVAVGRPSRPGTNSRLAIAMPALNAESTAASAMDCHSTIAARGARIGHVARASRAGTGPTRSSATMVKASADTLTVSLRESPDRHWTGAFRACALQLGQRAPQRGRLVGADPLDEVHERGLPATRVRGLVERIDHQPGDQLVAAVRRRVAVGAIVAMLDHEVLLRQPLQHGHDRGVGQVALRPTAPRVPGARFGARATDHRWSITARSRSPRRVNLAMFRSSPKERCIKGTTALLPCVVSKPGYPILRSDTLRWHRS